MRKPCAVMVQHSSETLQPLIRSKYVKSGLRWGGRAQNPIISSMLVSDFQYDLPPERIAQQPLADRADSRLLHLTHRSLERGPGASQGESWRDRKFPEFPDLLRSGDLLVLNNTRVFPARLYGYRGGQRAHPL